MLTSSVSQCSQSDLICLALVSSHFRDLAAAQLYRHFHIVFPDDDDPAFDSPIDSLAGGLETFVTGEYDYAQHMRELLLDTLSVGGKAENAYKPYLYSLSCGKFMNTLLLLTLRRATSLETFHWNIRVELSRQVYRALHQMPSLRHLHLRLQAGPSLFEVPPPLPYSPAPSIAHTAPTASYWHSGADATLSTSSVSSGFLPYGTPASLPSPKAVAPKNRRKTTIDIDPPTISGFKKLKTLSILDIDSLELVTEIKACIRNSSLTLNKLKLSFSSRLATQARKPRARDLDDDDDDPDDDFQVVPLPAPSSSWDDAAPSVVAFRAQQERKAQEAVLGRIFDLEHYLVKKEPQSLAPEKEKTVVSETTVPAAGEPSLPAQLFMDRLKEVSDRLALETEEGLDLDPATKQEILSSIHKAAKKYIEAMEAPAAPTAGPANKTEAEPTTEEKVKTETKDATEAKETTKTTFQTSDKVSSPDDIDIEAPITTEDSDEATEQPTLPEAAEKPAEKTREKDQVPSAAVIRASLTLEVQKENFSKVVAQLQKLKDQATDLQNELVTMHDNGGLASDIANLEKKVAEYGLWIRSNQEELEIVRREIQDAAKQAGVDTTEEEREFARISDYIKSTRGIPLRSFSVYLMPLKASTLRDAVDLQALHKLTLLNVGSQTGIWAMLARENRKSALPLRKIFTDHASKVFLACVKQLNRVDELYMLERSESYKPESFAPKAGTTMQDIRRAVLKKHLTTLRRLVIKNDADTAWDADEKTVFLLCNRGARLEELAVSLNIRSMVRFLSTGECRSTNTLTAHSDAERAATG
jgi:hypothetical protein